MLDLSALHFGRDSLKVKGTQQFVDYKEEEQYKFLPVPSGRPLTLRFSLPLFCLPKGQNSIIRYG